MATRRLYLSALATLGLLVADNILTNRVAVGALYIPIRVASTAGVLGLAMRGAGCSLRDLGLHRDQVGRGALWGAVIAAATLIVMAVAAAVPATSDFYRDDRAGSIGAAGLAYQVLLRIPLGTVLPEEIFFRGALLALGRRMWPTPVAVLVSSVIFGLWHVLPAQTLTHANEGLTRTGIGDAVVLSGVLSTAVAGASFCWLRLRSDSVVAPVLVHVATNAGGFALAFFVLH